MKRRVLKLLGALLLPAGAVLISSCGAEDLNTSEVQLDEASDNWIFFNGDFSEYGHCNNAIDDNGDGLVDSHDPDCHINPGPLRDLSILRFPIGHNFLPDITRDLWTSPGFDMDWRDPSAIGSDFRDPDTMVRWFRWLTEPDGWVAGIDLLDPGFNPEVVPIPAILPEAILTGTTHPGNNNNLSVRKLHVVDMMHPPLPIAVAGAESAGPAAAASAIAADSAGNAPAADAAVTKKLNASSRYNTKVYTISRGPEGGFPGDFYESQGPFGGRGSQGAVKPARTGNPN